MHVIIIDLLESKHTEAHGLQCSTETFWWLLTYTILTPITFILQFAFNSI